MALTATHIKFALDMSKNYQVENIFRFITGALYPDSRYKTKTKRDLTHPADFKKWDIRLLSDFQKGWLTHLHCDQSQRDVFMQLFPEYFDNNPIEFGTETWITITAIKLLQDMEDMKKFDVILNLP